MAASNERSLQALLASRVEAMGLRAELPWVKLEELGRQWLRFGRVMNLSGARDLSALSEQVLEGVQVVALAQRLGCAAGQRWIDVGSGAGFPGLIVAACLPVEIVLLEPRERRASFLELMLAQVGARGTVVRGRLEADGVRAERAGLSGMGQFEWASARAVFSPGEWLTSARKLMGSAGVIVAHLHRGDPDPEGWCAVDVVDGERWSVRAYRCST